MTQRTNEESCPVLHSLRENVCNKTVVRIPPFHSLNLSQQKKRIKYDIGLCLSFRSGPSRGVPVRVPVQTPWRAVFLVSCSFFLECFLVLRPVSCPHYVTTSQVCKRGEGEFVCGWFMPGVVGWWVPSPFRGPWDSPGRPRPYGLSSAVCL